MERTFFTMYFDPLFIFFEWQKTRHLCKWKILFPPTDSRWSLPNPKNFIIAISSWKALYYQMSSNWKARPIACTHQSALHQSFAAANQQVILFFGKKISLTSSQVHLSDAIRTPSDLFDAIKCMASQWAIHTRSTATHHPFAQRAFW